MASVRVPLETVTPLFLSGAYARGEPELRPPSIRGALRYWLRAALSGAYGDDQGGLAQVREKESSVFGSTDEERGGASAIGIRIGGQNVQSAARYQRRSGPPSGRDYLYWSMDKSGSVERNNYQPPKQYIPPPSRFDLILTARPGAADETQPMQCALAALWLLIHCGGLGSRARRTGGSLSVPTPCTTEGLAFGLASSVPATAAAELVAGLAQVRRLMGASVMVATPSTFDVLHPATCRVWVLGGWETSADAVEYVGAAMRDFRTYRSPDHENVAPWLLGQTAPETVERAAFGLPIPYRYSQGGPSGTIQAEDKSGKVIERRASPLWLTITHALDGGYVVVATLFKSQFLPDKAELSARPFNAKRSPLPPPSDYALIETWIEEMFAYRKEVVYA